MDKANTSYTHNSAITSKQDLSIGETFTKAFSNHENVYRSPFNDPNLHYPQIGQNDTLSLDYSSNPLLYKAGNKESSAWLTEICDATLHKGKDSPTLQSHDLDSSERSRTQTYLQGQSLDYCSASGMSQQSPKLLYNRANSNPFGHSSPLYNITDMKIESDTSLYSQPRTILSETTKETLKYRVKAALLRLKGWEESRVENINNHRRICDNIFEALTERISVSKQGLKRMIKFFIERIKHIRAFAKMSSGFTKLEPGFTSLTDDTSGWVFPKLLKECDAFQLKHIEKCKVLASFIEKEILRNILEKEDRRFREKVEPLIQRYKKVKANLAKENERAAQATADYVGLYKKALNNQKIDRDLFVAELGFLKQARDQTMAQKELGIFTALFIKELQNLEIARLENLKQAMKVYVETMNLLYGAENNRLVLGTMTHFNIEQEAQKIYAINRLLKEDDLELLNLSGDMATPDTCMNHLMEYLNGIKFYNVQTNPLVLYESKASVEENGLMLGTKQSSVALSVDRNVVVFDLNVEKQEYIVHKIIKFSSMIFKQTNVNSNTVEFFEVKKKRLEII